MNRASSSNWNQYARLQYRERQRTNGSYVDRRKRLDQRTEPAVNPRSIGGGTWFNQEIADKDVLWDDPYALIETVSLSTIREAHRLYPSGSAYISPEDNLLAAVVRSPYHQLVPRDAPAPQASPSSLPIKRTPVDPRTPHRKVRDAAINLQIALNAFGADANWKPLMNELREAVDQLPEQA